MKQPFLILGLIALAGGAVTIFAGGQSASFPTALLGIMSLTIGAASIFVAGMFKAKESKHVPILFPTQEAKDESESWKKPEPECQRRKRRKNRFSL